MLDRKRGEEGPGMGTASADTSSEETGPGRGLGPGTRGALTHWLVQDSVPQPPPTPGFGTSRLPNCERLLGAACVLSHVAYSPPTTSPVSSS